MQQGMTGMSPEREISIYGKAVNQEENVSANKKKASNPCNGKHLVHNNSLELGLIYVLARP